MDLKRWYVLFSSTLLPRPRRYGRLRRLDRTNVLRGDVGEYRISNVEIAVFELIVAGDIGEQSRRDLVAFEGEPCESSHRGDIPYVALPLVLLAGGLVCKRHTPGIEGDLGGAFVVNGPQVRVGESGDESASQWSSQTTVTFRA